MKMKDGILRVHPNSKKVRIVHVETDLGIFNIHLGGTDFKGRRVESVGLIPNRYAGEPKVVVLKRFCFRELKRKA